MENAYRPSKDYAEILSNIKRMIKSTPITNNMIERIEKEYKPSREYKNILENFEKMIEPTIIKNRKTLGNIKDKIEKSNFSYNEYTKVQYRKYISDLSGVEVAAHGNTIKKTVFFVRNWLKTSSRRKYIAPATKISSRFIKFQREIKKICKRKGYDYDEMSFLELVKNMTDWLLLNKYIHEPLFH